MSLDAEQVAMVKEIVAALKAGDPEAYKLVCDQADRIAAAIIFGLLPEEAQNSIMFHQFTQAMKDDAEGNQRG